MQRRQFFKISAGVAFSLSSLPMTAIAADKSDVRSNVLVVGGGMAGLCAAISAKQSGASKVMLVEKGGFLGGHSILSGSGYWIGGTKIQKKAGIDDSLEINWQDSLERGLKLNRPEIRTEFSRSIIVFVNLCQLISFTLVSFFIRFSALPVMV